MIEIFGFTISNNTLFFLFLIVIAMFMLVFFRNRKYNLLTIQAIGKELETALQPKDQTYTWLGGSVGFTAEYQTEQPLRKADATVTMLARQSVLFYPISKLMFGNDRLFVVLHPYEKFRREVHLIEKWYYKLRLRRLENEASLLHDTIHLQGKTFDIFSSDKAGIEKLSAWIKSIPSPALIKHVAFTPESKTIYLYMNPQVEFVARTITELVKLAEK